MNRVLTKIFMILLGVLICIGAQILWHAIRNFPVSQKHISAIRRAGLSDRDVEMWEKLHEAIRLHDCTAANEILKVSPGELELRVRVCSAYPNGFGPIARIFIKNVSSRPVVILKPTVTRLTSQSSDALNRLRDGFSILCSSAGSPDWCRVLEPQQVFAIPMAEIAVEGVGLHEVNFTLETPVYELIGEQQVKARFVKISDTTITFKIEGESER